MNVRGAFWRFAHWRYHPRRPSRVVEITLFTWGCFFAAAFLVSFVTDWAKVTNYVGAVFFVGVPLSIGFLHRRIRLERSKGNDALYRKRLATNP
jgi:ACR3 family arsenite efflux pump ArsB